MGIIVGAEGCPLCQEVHEQHPDWPYYLADDLLSGKHEHGEDFLVAIAMADLAPSGLDLPVILTDDWRDVVS